MQHHQWKSCIKELSLKRSGGAGSVFDACQMEDKAGMVVGYLVVIVAAVYKGQMLQFSSPRSECHVQTLQDN